MLRVNLPRYHGVDDPTFGPLIKAAQEEFSALAQLLSDRTGLQHWELSMEVSNGNLRVGLRGLMDSSLVGTRKGDETKIQLLRVFDPSNKLLDHDFFEIGPALQNKGLSDLVLRASVSVMDKLKWSNITLFANLDVGAYAWLRKGFWPASGRKQLDAMLRQSSILEQISKADYERWMALSDVEARAFVLSPEFRSYRKALLGKSWGGVGNLRDPLARDAMTKGTVAAYQAHQARLNPPKPGLPNERLKDAVLHHQIALRRFTNTEIKAITRLMEKADAELVTLLRARLANLAGKPLDLTSQRMKDLLASMNEARRTLINDVTTRTRADFAELGVIEAATEASILTATAPVALTLNSVDVNTLRTIVTSKPFQGRVMKDWFSTLAAQDQARLRQAVQLGLGQGETVDQIVRRVAGTRAAKYADGALAITRRDAAAVVRTAATHVSNEARAAVWKANDDVVGGLVWSSTLDGRTTMVCASRDGHWAPLDETDETSEPPDGLPPLDPPTARPPAHYNCRSSMIPYFDPDTLGGDRPFVRDSRTRAEREADFRRQARETGRSVKDIRAEWSRTHVGQVPAATNYSDWLGTQSAAFQNEVLGPGRAALFRQGGLTLDQFVDRDGSLLTLAELRELDPAAFLRAGID